MLRRPRLLHDKVIVITGASSGIGAATAIACAKAGMHVTLGARRPDRLRQVADRVEALGRRALCVSCDVDRDQDVRHLFEQSWQMFGQLDAAFANAGYGLVAPVLETPDDQTRAIFETNFHGTLRTMRFALPDLKRTHDGLNHLLICASAASEIAPPHYGIYAATKAAQDSIATAMRAELRPRRIHVSTVHPVGTRTEFFDIARQACEHHDPIGQNTPDVFKQTPDHVAGCIVRCLRRPIPEVWPMPASRFGVALTTACPRLSAYVLRRMARRRHRG